MTSVHRMRKSVAMTVVAAAASLAASGCGGGGGSDDPSAAAVGTAEDGAAVPSTAAASTKRFIDFQQGMQASDTAEPLLLLDFLAPKDDRAEPSPVE